MEKVKEAKLSELIQDDHNLNKGTERGQELIKKSMKKFGAGRSILIDKNNRIIAGNKAHINAEKTGIEDVIIIETDGKKLVAVKRTDIDPYYPIPSNENLLKYEKYKDECKRVYNGKVLFGGRLGGYKYYAMDDAIYVALRAVENVSIKV